MKAPPVVATITIPVPDLAGITWTAPLPETLTQNNVEAITGVPPPVYLKHTRSPAFPLKVGKVGKLRVVDRAAFVAWLMEQNDAIQRAPANDAVDAVDELAAAAGLLPSTRTVARR